MKILITTCGVGIGHSSRDLALANYLKKYGHNIEFASYGSGLKYLQKYDFKTYNLPKMNFEGKDGEIDIEESIKQSKDIPFTFIKSMYKEARIIKKTKPDVIICDSHYSMPITAKFFNIPCYLITNDLTFGFSESTNIKSIKYFEKSIRRFIIEITKSCKKIMIPDTPGIIEVPVELEDKTKYIGPLLHHNSNEIASKEELRKKYNLNLDDKILVVTIGGSEFGKILINDICNISKDIEADKIFIFTGFEVDLSNFKDYDNNKVILTEFTDNLVEWMKLSDLTITLAGHTTSMELLSIKQPNIMVPLSNHVEQGRNSQRMLKTGITRVVEINNPEKLLTNINDSLNQLDSLKINDEIYENFLLYDGKKNALNIIQI